METAVESLKSEAAPPNGAVLPPPLSEVARLRLDAASWKRKAMAARYQAVKAACEADLEMAARDVNAADAELRKTAAAAGIDVSRAFEWDDQGVVSYPAPQRPGPSPEVDRAARAAAGDPKTKGK